VRAVLDGVIPRAILIKRTLDGPGGSEEIVSSHFKIVQQCAVSQNETFALIAGRLKDAGPEQSNSDGIFLLNRSNGIIEYVAPFENAGLNESTRSLNVGDRGDLVVYEESGAIVRLTRMRGCFSATERHPGQLPALMPSGEAYVYVDHDRLIWSDGKVQRDLMRVRNVVGGVRVSPDGHFVAFGVDASGPATSRHLEICELNAKACVAGPAYDEWIPGRETFWIRR
jgi:hypothetical protein